MSEIVKQIVIPPRLKSGDTIGLITPAGPILNHDKVRAGIAVLEEAGFKIKQPPDLEQSEYLAGNDEDRAQQLSEIWNDEEVHAVLAIRGGYGAMRLLPHLDLAQFIDKPKILAGFSDVTILLNEIHCRTGLVTYHSPMLTTLSGSDEVSQRSFLEMLTGAPSAITSADLQLLTGGNVRGQLIGGNLASLCHLLGTPYEPVWQDAILFLEDIGEAPYQIDRMLTQLQATGRLSLINGLILGTFSDEDEKGEKFSKQIWARAGELTEGKIPLWGNFPVGHGSRNMTMPVGMNAVMDSENGRLKFLNPNNCQY